MYLKQLLKVLEKYTYIEAWQWSYDNSMDMWSYKILYKGRVWGVKYCDRDLLNGLIVDYIEVGGSGHSMQINVKKRIDNERQV